MRLSKFGMVGLGALLAARVVVGCSSDDGEPGYDAGTLPDAEIAGDSGSNEDTGTLPNGRDSGPDATVSDDGGGSSDDSGDDTSTLPTDASDGGGHEVDAGDGGHEDVDASDGGHALDASDGSAAAVDASDGSSPALDSGEDSSSPIDAAQDSSSEDDAAPACVSCGMTVSFLGNTAAFVTGGAGIALQSGTVPDGATVSVTTQTYPQGSVTAGNMHLVYATDQNFTTQIDLPMTFDHQAGNNDQWYAIVPVEPANTTVYWYLHANGCDCSTVLYDNPGGLSSFTYTEQ